MTTPPTIPTLISLSPFWLEVNEISVTQFVAGELLHSGTDQILELRLFFFFFCRHVNENLFKKPLLLVHLCGASFVPWHRPNKCLFTSQGRIKMRQFDSSLGSWVFHYEISLHANYHWLLLCTHWEHCSASTNLFFSPSVHGSTILDYCLSSLLCHNYMLAKIFIFFYFVLSNVVSCGNDVSQHLPYSGFIPLSRVLILSASAPIGSLFSVLKYFRKTSFLDS